MKTASCDSKGYTAPKPAVTRVDEGQADRVVGPENGMVLPFNSREHSGAIDGAPMMEKE